MRTVERAIGLVLAALVVAGCSSDPTESSECQALAADLSAVQAERDTLAAELEAAIAIPSIFQEFEAA